MTAGPSPAARRWQPLSSIRSRLLALVALVSVPATVTFAVIARGGWRAWVCHQVGVGQ